MPGSPHQALILMFFLLRGQGILADCDGNYITYLTATDTPKVLTSPNYPYNYPNNCVYKWKITSIYDAVTIQIQSMNLEHSANCEWDVFAITESDYDYSSSNAYKLCDYPRTAGERHILSKSKEVYYVFKSDSSNDESGFKIYYQAKEIKLDRNILCNDVQLNNSYSYEITASLSNIDTTMPYVISLERTYRCSSYTVDLGTATRSTSQLLSPGYPFTFPHNSQCTWKLRSDYSAIKFTIINSDLGSDCSDHLDFHSGYSSSGRREKTLCGSSTQSFLVESQNVFIDFISVSYDGSFKIEYQAGDFTCGHLLPEDLSADESYQTLTSPGYPYTYAPNIKCEWLITTYADYIKLMFDDIDLEDTSSCSYDVVEIFSGDSATTSNRFGKYCSTDSKYTTISVHSKKVRIRFKTDASNEETGFKIGYRGAYYSTTTTQSIATTTTQSIATTTTQSIHYDDPDVSSDSSSSLPVYAYALIPGAGVLFLMCLVILYKVARRRSERQVRSGRRLGQAQTRPQQQAAGHELRPISTICSPQPTAPRMSAYPMHNPAFQPDDAPPSYHEVVNMYQNFVPGSNPGALATELAQGVSAPGHPEDDDENVYYGLD